MAENNNNNGKKRNDIFTKINDTISTFLMSLIFTYGILALIVIYIVYRAKLVMTRDENSFLLNERLKYQKKEYEERERRRAEQNKKQ